jgi:hypothetical protein
MNRLLLFALIVLSMSLFSVMAALADDKPIKPTNLPFNTKADEDEPFVTSNSQKLYYTSNEAGKFDIMVSSWENGNKKWGAGKLLEDYVRTPVDDRGVFVTAEQKFPQFLYYATKKDKEGTNFDLYVAVKQGAGKAFSEPTPVNGGVNTEEDEMHPWITSDGKQLYFSRKTKDGWRVCVALRKDAAGPQGFGEPKLVKELPVGFHHATLTPDGKTMYLQGPLEKGRWGLFISTKEKDGWGKPEALEQFNHPEGPTGDRSPSLSRDGATLYFASDRPEGKGGLDIWSIPTAALAKKK